MWHRSLEGARRIADVLHAPPISTGRRYVRMGDVGLAGLLSTVRDDPRWTAFAEAQLAPVQRHDLECGTDLEGLLLAYIETGGNNSALARLRHLSRPTVHQRLTKVEQLLSSSSTQRPSAR